MTMIRKLVGREGGQALVETSLALIVFFIMVMGTVDVSRAIWNYNTLAQATREGTRYAIVHGANSSDPSGPGDDQDILDVVGDHGSGLASGSLSVTTAWPDGGNQAGNRVTVDSQYTFTPIFNFLGAVTFAMSSSSTMEITN